MICCKNSTVPSHSIYSTQWAADLGLGTLSHQFGAILDIPVLRAPHVERCPGRTCGSCVLHRKMCCMNSIRSNRRYKEQGRVVAYNSCVLSGPLYNFFRPSLRVFQ